MLIHEEIIMILGLNFTETTVVISILHCKTELTHSGMGDIEILGLSPLLNRAEQIFSFCSVQIS
jgi:hypothetical protein